MNQSNVRVVVADEHVLFRAGLRMLLQKAAGFQIIEASTPDDTLDAVETHAPDLALLDAALSGNNFEVVKEIKRIHPHTRVLLLLAAGGESNAALAEEAGVSGCVSRQSSPDELVRTIQKSAPSVKSRPAFRKQVIRPAFNENSDANASKTHTPLTRREQEVLDLVMRGESSREIAETLSLSIKTVEAHKFNLMRKLDVHSRSELIRLALRTQINSYTNQPSTVA